MSLTSEREIKKAERVKGIEYTKLRVEWKMLNCGKGIENLKNKREKNETSITICMHPSEAVLRTVLCSRQWR